MICRILAVLTVVVTVAAHAQDSGADRALAGADILLDTLKSAQSSKVQFSGIAGFKDEDLRAAMAEQIREIDEKGATPTRADDAAYFTGSFYRKSGYAKVETSYEIQGDRVIVKVDEGPRTLLRKVIFTGNSTYSKQVLFEYMIGAPEERLEKDTDLFPYNQRELSNGADRVRGFYVSEGYLDAVVDASSISISADGRSATATVKITENGRYTFGDLRFAGETLFSREDLLKAVREDPHGPFSRTKAISMQRNLESFYRSKGYFQVAVSLEAEPKLALKGRVPVVLTIKPGSLFRFDGVTVKNQTSPKGRLRDSFLPNRFKHLNGKIYEPEKVDETFRELLRSGLFANLRLNPVALPDHTVRLDFTAEEAKSREVGFTLGYGTYDGGKVGIRLADRDLFGNGRPLSFAADFSQRGITADLTYFDPWFLDHPRMNFRAKLFSADRQELGYAKTETGGRIEVGWRVLPHWEVGAFALDSKVNVTDSTIDPLLLGPTDYDLISVGVTQTANFTDSQTAPTRGWIFTTAFDVGTIAGETAFTRSVARVSWYKPIGKCQLSLGARVGAIQPIAESIPIDVRFFNGGATTVRSFAERELGPKDKGGNPLGGEFYTAFNAEFEFPITGGLRGAVFVDAGNLKDWRTADFGDLRYALGVGLRYALPVGPLRLDYGINPDRRADEDFGAFHLSFGVAF